MDAGNLVYPIKTLPLLKILPDIRKSSEHGNKNKAGHRQCPP